MGKGKRRKKKKNSLIKKNYSQTEGMNSSRSLTKGRKGVRPTPPPPARILRRKGKK